MRKLRNRWRASCTWQALLALLAGCLLLQWALRGLISRCLPGGQQEQDALRILQHDWGGSGDCSAAAALFQATLPPSSQAVAFPGGAAAWRAGLPTLPALAELPDFEGLMLVSRNTSFTLFNNSTAYQALERSDPDQLPNRLLRRSFAEFLAHAQHRRPPLFYGRAERYYFQGSLPPQLDFERLLNTSPLGCLGVPRGSDTAKVDWYTAMLRVTPAGAKHSLHWDTSNSALVMLAGRKRVTLVHASQLARLDPYPQGHLLFRRARLPEASGGSGGGWQRPPMRGQTVDMRPGDVLVFPARTSHQTLALEDFTVSVSVRYSLPEEPWR